MNTKLYVGNLPFSSTEQDVRELFSQHGNVTEATLIIDRMTGRSRGFAFVSYDSEDAAQRAIQNLDGQDIDGRKLTVNIARPKEDRPYSGGGGGGGGGGGYRGGGGGGGYRGGGGGGGGGYRGGPRGDRH
ncbi:MAG: RNA-binding protein [Verrucomicrobium sp.]|nr:RNA-binding protein [Verrucomicrobium sp.]